VSTTAEIRIVSKDKGGCLAWAGVKTRRMILEAALFNMVGNILASEKTVAGGELNDQ